MTMHKRLIDLKGNKIAENVCDFFNQWEWIKRVIIDKFECEDEDVGVAETETGDYITVRNEPVAVLQQHWDGMWVNT